MKRIVCFIFALILMLASFSVAATANDTPRFSASGGGLQLYIRYEKTSLYVENGQISAASNQKTTQIASNALNGLFYVGRYAVGFSQQPDKSGEAWFSYNVDTGLTKYKIIPTMSLPFWGDEKGLFYADYASKPNIFCYNPKTGKTQKLMSAITGQPRGYSGDKLICVDSSKNRILSYDSKKNMSVVFSDGSDILDCSVIAQKVFVLRPDGLYQLENGRLKQLYDRYAPIVAVAEPYFITVTSDDGNGASLQGVLSLHLNDAQNGTRALLTNNTGLQASQILSSAGISSAGNTLTFGNQIGNASSSKSFLLPKTGDMRPY